MQDEDEEQPEEEEHRGEAESESNKQGMYQIHTEMNRPPTIGDILEPRIPGFSVHDAARCLSISVEEWCKLKSGALRPDDDFLAQVSSLFGISKKELQDIDAKFVAWKKDLDERFAPNPAPIERTQTEDSTEQRRQPMSLGTLRKKILSSLTAPMPKGMGF